jgi:hypothetical protein
VPNILSDPFGHCVRADDRFAHVAVDLVEFSVSCRIVDSLLRRRNQNVSSLRQFQLADQLQPVLRGREAANRQILLLEMFGQSLRQCDLIRRIDERFRSERRRRKS